MSKVKVGITLTKKAKKIIYDYAKKKGCSAGYFLEEAAMMRIEREKAQIQEYKKVGE